MAKAERVSGLECEADASSGARLVLMSRVHEMVALREKALDWSDPEGVHDMRVASRRLRSGLRDFRLLFPKRDVALLSKASKIFADSLGGVRDEDVAIIALEKLRLRAPSEAHVGVDSLLAERAERREQARVHLVETITEERLASLLQLFTERIADGGAGGRQSESLSEVVFRALGRERIGKQFRRLSKRAVCLYRPTASEELHELRIEAKRLRYALELFAVCWDNKLNEFSDRVAELQGALGEVHDCDVWIADLGRKLVGFHSIQDQGGDNALSEQRDSAVRSACVWLLDYFAKERTKHYREALNFWAQWQASGFAARLNEALQDEADRKTQSSSIGKMSTGGEGSATLKTSNASPSEKDGRHASPGKTLSSRRSSSTRTVKS